MSSALSMTGRNVLVTGASKGIGLACARAFADAGARVAIVSRSRENLARARASFASDGAPVTIAADLRDPAQAARAVEEAYAALGDLDVLVNSAGAAKRRRRVTRSPSSTAIAACPRVNQRVSRCPCSGQCFSCRPTHIGNTETWQETERPPRRRLS